MAIGTTCATWHDGRWHDANVPIMGAADHGTWLGTMVFDGARAFEGTTPDLDRHCARLVRSAEIMGLAPPMGADEIAALIVDGVSRFARGSAFYLRPMMWSREGSPSLIDPLPESTGFAVCIEDLPLREPQGFALTVSPYRRPPADAALNEAKASCHYPNNARLVRDARTRGFDNALSLDQAGNVAETASTNAFLVRDGVVRTPVPNGTFLNGITRQRVMALLRADGIMVEEASLTVADFAAADEIFLTGNASKVVPVTRFEDRHGLSTATARRARALYWDYAHQTRQAA
jgi:branched-chain amino acid aminotransferase